MSSPPLASPVPTRRALSGTALIGLVAAVIVAIALPVFTSGYVVYIANLLLVFVVLCLAKQTGTDLQTAWESRMLKKTARDADRHRENPKLR